MPRTRKTLHPDEMLSDTPCRCGHELGDHRATTLRQCATQGCECEKLRAKTPQERP